ncbi:MAG: Glu-tRNA(Gln) amidotransferase subunit GatE [Candidatus Krumholzibacteriia bacterium]
MSHDLPVNDPRLRGPLPDHGAWTEAQYRELGLKVGLEIHQQLLTAHKLFCRCPAGRYTHEFDAEILRHMRPTLSELGEYDGTALMEFKTRKEIIYRLKNESVCTYEMDDAPPFELNAEALDRAVAIALLLGCQVVGEVHIARKQYLDGSIPTGFQRTAIVGVAGKVPFRGREVFIRQLAIEEDSCREVTDRGHIRTYRTDRLGMPLIETVTDPDMRTPEEAAAVGQLLRRLVRVTGLVRTGAGAARQDVNVSIEGGTRIEIKGVPSLRANTALVHCEALRQRSLLAIRDVLADRGVQAAALKDRTVDVTPILRATDCVFIRRALDEGAAAAAVPLPGFAGLLEAPTQPRTTFLREFADRVRVIACLDGVPNLVCSTLEGTLSSNEWVRIGKACGVSPETPVLVVWGRPEDIATAGREIMLRAREATLGVPSETRQALDDGTNAFERILPGPNRMYPDTDLPPVRLEDARVQGIAAGLPEPPWQRVARLRGLGVGEDLAERLARHRAYDLFLHLAPRLRAGALPAPQGLASLLLDRSCPRPPSLAAAGAWWERVVARLERGEIVPEGVWSSDDEPPAALADPEARRQATAALAALPADGPAEPVRREEWAMGHVMRALRGRVSGRRVRAWLKEARS